MSWVTRLLGKRDREKELDEELRSHLEMAEREHRERGVNGVEAARAARRELGNMELVKETTRDSWSWRFLDRLMHGLTDGALIVLPEESSEELERFLDQGYRFVVIDPRLPLDERIPSVSAAHTSGAHLAMAHLLELGHEVLGGDLVEAGFQHRREVLGRVAVRPYPKTS